MFFLILVIVVILWVVNTARIAYCNVNLFKYITLGDEFRIRELLRTRVDVNTHDVNGLTPLMVSAQKGNIRIVKLLLDAGANPHLADNKGFKAQDHALYFGHPEIVVLIKQYM